MLENIDAKKWLVYRHTSPSGKVYIGITHHTDPNRRWQNGKGYNNCPIFHKAILKYGWENIKHEVLFKDLTEKRAKDLEIALVRHYKKLGISYNATDGGDGHLGYVPSQETRDKIKKAHLGKKMTAEQLEKVRQRAKERVGIPRNEETKRKLHEANKGKKPSAQTIAALKLYNKQHPLSKERLQEMHEASKRAGYKNQIDVLNKNREQIGEKHRKGVVQFSLDGKYLHEYEGTKFASAATGIDSSSIVKCCKGKAFKAGEYLWLYKTEYLDYLNSNVLDAVIKDKVAKALKGPGKYVRSVDWRKQKSMSLKGQDYRSQETKEKMTEAARVANMKPIMQLTLKDELVSVFPSAKMVEIKYNYSGGFISGCCKGKHTQAYGYKWKFITKEEYEKYKEAI